MSLYGENVQEAPAPELRAKAGLFKPAGYKQEMVVQQSLIGFHERYHYIKLMLYPVWYARST